MNRYIYYIFGLVLSLVLVSCSTSDIEGDAVGEQDYGIINFKLGGSAAAPITRATSQSATESAVSKLYVVAFKNNVLKAVVEASFDNTSSTYSANVGASGTLDLYFVANPSEALENTIKGLSTSTTPGDLLARTESEAPATDGSEDAFLMTAHATASVRSTDTEGTTLSGAINLSRAAARIDITSVPTGFTIKKVTLVNRYTQTKLGRIGDSDNSMASLAKANTEYTAGITPGSSTTDYKGYIYAYEDLVGTAQIVVDGKYNGLDVTGITVDFATAGTGGNPLLIKRNNVYEIALNKASENLTLQDVKATLTVVDWNTGAVLSKATDALTDRTSAPAVAFSNLNNCKESGSNISITDVTLPASFTATITNSGSTLSKLVCSSLYDTYKGNITTGEDIIIESSTPVYNADGTSTQVFNVIIDSNVSGSTRYFTLKAENLLSKTHATTFYVGGGLFPLVVGDLLFDDGLWGSLDNFPDKTPVGIVFSTAVSAADIAAGYKHGYAVALKTVGTGVADGTGDATMAWSTESEQLGTSTNGYPAVNLSSDELVGDYVASARYMDGRSETALITNRTGYSSSTYPAAYAAVTTYASTVAPPSGASNWYLPSIGQWYELIKAFGGITGYPDTYRTEICGGYWAGKSSATASAINTYAASKLTSTANSVDLSSQWVNFYWASSGNSGYYWSSTESEKGAGYAFDLHISAGGNLDLNGNNTKSTTVQRVRPVIAF